MQPSEMKAQVSRVDVLAFPGTVIALAALSHLSPWHCVLESGKLIMNKSVICFKLLWRLTAANSLRLSLPVLGLSLGWAGGWPRAGVLHNRAERLEIILEIYVLKQFNVIYSLSKNTLCRCQSNTYIEDVSNLTMVLCVFCADTCRVTPNSSAQWIHSQIDDDKCVYFKE